MGFSFAQAASRNLREAIAIAPDNEDVKSAFEKIKEDEETSHPLLNLCRRYITQRDEEAAKDAVKYLHSPGLQPPPEVALDCLKLVLSISAPKLSISQDDIISGLVRQSAHIRRYFAAQLQVSTTEFFDGIYDRGDGAVMCLDMVVLETGLWQSEKTRSHCETELFQLFIAKLMESGHDHDGRSLKGIARLLAVDANSLQHLVDEEGFDVILSSLDRRLPIDVRSQATLATAKYLEASGDAGQQLFSKFISDRVSKRRNDDYIIAFSASAVAFPIVPEAATTLFLTEGFLQSLTPLLDRRHKSSSLELAVLELFNAGCVDRPCREAIAKYHTEWLSHKVSNGTEECTALAAVVLAKIRASQPETAAEAGKSGIIEDHTTISDLVDRFKQQLARHDQEGNVKHLLEGLAYSSVKPEMKEKLCHDGRFLKDLLKVLLNHTLDSSVLYGGLMIISNLTQYLPNLSEEQKKISELKAYANASKPRQAPNHLDDDDHVKSRCSALIDAGVMPLLIECGGKSLASIRELCSKVLLSLSKDSKVRGKLAQQGAVKLLITVLLSQEGTKNVKSEEAIRIGAHALARILISVNPSLVFPASGFPQITSAIRPLLSILSPQQTSITSDQPRDLLPVFESLLALTNLASSPDSNVADSIVRSGWPTVEDLLLSQHSYIQRAACELTCNLMTCNPGLGKFADGSQRAGQRLHILLALADVDDKPTRLAAGGALAMLTEFEGAVASIIGRPRGVEILLGLCQEEDEGLVHRGAVCVHNLLYSSGDIGRRAREALTDKGAFETMKECVMKTKNPAVQQSGVEALKKLANHA